jgi:DNA-binding NtrC family response regulator
LPLHLRRRETSVPQNSILLVLDNLQSARHLSTLLREAGYRVDWQPLNEASIKSVSSRPDLIIFDSQLLDDEDLRVFRVMRERHGWRDIPLLVIATILDGDTKARVRILEADEVVTKPIDANELLTRIRSTLRLQLYEAEAKRAKRERAVSRDDLRHLANDPLAHLSFVAATQASEQSLETIFVELLRHTRRLIQFDEGMICIEAAPGRYGVLAHVGGGKCDLATYYEVGESYTGWLALHRVPLLVSDVDKEPRVRMLGRAQGKNRYVNSFVGLPLIASAHVVGTLEMHSYRHHAYDESALETLRPIAEIASLALRNARTRQEFAKHVDILREEFDRCRQQVLPVYESLAIDRVMKAAEKIKDSQCAVLITGDTGTGKELIARFIHYEGNRRHFPFVDINCAAVPESLQESELFGIEKGIATGVDKRIGKFELCGAGALFLDEVAYMPLSMQNKLLRVLQERTFERVGGTTKLQFSGRIIAATSRDISHAIQEGSFREELYYRLAVIHLHIPPLRSRREDIPPLVRHFVRIFCNEQNRPLTRIPDAVMNRFVACDWPGNIRELRNSVERAVLLSQGDTLDFYENKAITEVGMEQKNDQVDLLLNAAFQEGLSVPELVNHYSRYVYERLGNNKSKTCKSLKINYRTLRSRLRSGGESSAHR